LFALHSYYWMVSIENIHQRTAHIVAFAQHNHTQILTDTHI